MGSDHSTTQTARSLTICHAADIHIRGKTRHQEYRIALAEFIKKCTFENPDAIILCGDIWHTKTHGFTPESIDLISWFFRSLCKISQTFIILGNHDENRLNKTQLDALSPIVDSVNDSRLILCKDQGTYRICDGYNLCVLTDVSDFTRNLDLFEINTDDVNIATYHGPVSGASSDDGWMMDGIDANFVLQKFDYLLLGDIHKRQFIDDAHRGAYCGSLIPQNYSEIDPKGFLVWEIAGKDRHDVTFRQLENYTPYITIQWPGSLALLDELCKTLPPQARYRVAIDSSDIPRNAVIQLLNERLFAEEVVFKQEKITAQPAEQKNAEDDCLVSIDETSTETITRRVKHFFSNDSTLDVENLEAQTRAYAAECFSTQQKHICVWSLQNMTFSNTFSYGEENSIDFSRMSGVLGIFAPNRRGKSSIIGTLLYALQNTSDRGSLRPADIINNDSDWCSASVKFTVGGKTFVVDRRSERHQNNAKSAVTRVDFNETKDDNNSMNGEQRNDTDKQIKAIVGSAADIMLTSISTQFEINSFVDLGGSHRKATIARHFGLEHYEALHVIAKRDADNYKASATIFDSTPWEALLKIEHEKLKLAGERAAELKEQSEKLSQMLAIHRTSLGSKTARNFISQAQIDSMKNKLRELEIKKDEAENFLNTTIDDMKHIGKEAERLEKITASVDTTALRKMLDDERRVSTNLVSFRHNHDKQIVELNILNSSMKMLSKKPCGDLFPSCPFIIETSDKQKNVAEINEKLSKINESISKLSHELNVYALRNTTGELEIAENAMKQAAAAQKAVVNANVMIANAREKFNAAEHELDKQRTRVNDSMKHVVDTESIARLVKLEKRITELTGELTEIDNSLIDAMATIKSSNTAIDRISSEQARRESDKKEWKIRSSLADAFSKHGIPELLIEEKLPLVNSEIANIIGTLHGFNVTLVRDEKNGDVNVLIDNNGKLQRKIESCCGMEKVICSLAIRAALAKISTLPRSDVFMIDEGFGSLDEQSLDACRLLLRSLANSFRAIIIITHVEQMKDFVDSVIEITRNEKTGRSEISA